MSWEQTQGFIDKFTSIKKIILCSEWEQEAEAMCKRIVYQSKKYQQLYLFFYTNNGGVCNISYNRHNYYGINNRRNTCNIRYNKRKNWFGFIGFFSLCRLSFYIRITSVYSGMCQISVFNFQKRKRDEIKFKITSITFEYFFHLQQIQYKPICTVPIKKLSSLQIKFKPIEFIYSIGFFIYFGNYMFSLFSQSRFKINLIRNSTAFIPYPFYCI